MYFAKNKLVYPLINKYQIPLTGCLLFKKAVIHIVENFLCNFKLAFWSKSYQE